jgi:hypothetical protein
VKCPLICQPLPVGSAPPPDRFDLRARKRAEGTLSFRIRRDLADVQGAVIQNNARMPADRWTMKRADCLERVERLEELPEDVARLLTDPARPAPPTPIRGRRRAESRPGGPRTKRAARWASVVARRSTTCGAPTEGRRRTCSDACAQAAAADNSATFTAEGALLNTGRPGWPLPSTAMKPGSSPLKSAGTSREVKTVGSRDPDPQRMPSSRTAAAIS